MPLEGLCTRQLWTLPYRQKIETSLSLSWSLSLSTQAQKTKELVLAGPVGPVLLQGGKSSVHTACKAHSREYTSPQARLGPWARKLSRITTCYYFEHAWERNTRPKHLHINVKEGLAGFAALATFYPLAPWRCALAHGDNTTEQATSEANRARSVLQTVVLQHRAAFVAETGVVVRQRRVKSKDNVLADAVSRLASKDFKREARRLGATRFVRLGLAASARALIDDAIVTLERLELDGENTSGTARSDAEVVSRERRYEEMQRRSERSPPEAPRRRRRWGFMTGFCGIGSMSCAAAQSGGEPVAGFDINESSAQAVDRAYGTDVLGGLLQRPRGGQRRPPRLARATRAHLHLGQSVPGFFERGARPRHGRTDGGFVD